MLRGKVALVTGGSRGIGRAIALKYADNGCSVAILYAGNVQAASEAVEEIQARGVRSLAIQCDVADFEAVRQAVDRVVKELGPIDILVNNAGVTEDKLALRMSEADFDRVVDVSLKGAFHLIRHSYAGFMRRRAGRIINITSVAGLMGNAGQANYAAAKAGLVGLTKTIARELASRNVTVNAIAPGFIHSDMTAKMPEAALAEGLKQVPMRRMGEPEEIAELALFLASDRAGYITGAVIQVDGGLYM